MNEPLVLYPFRQGAVRQPATKRIAKYASRPLSSFNVVICYATLFIQRQSARTSFRFIGTVAKKFFLVQYLEKIHLLHVPVKHVDNELDGKVPFKPEKLPVYMDFINFWVRNMAMLEHRFGIHDGILLCKEFLQYITLTYNEAYRIYRTVMTTTYRPPCSVRAITRMRRADPHYLCVPSLHVSVVCLTYSFYRMLFEREQFTEGEKSRWNQELYGQALRIAETVLYVKQHSVNCIPAALYMLTRIVPELFTPQDAVTFINDLFKDADDVREEDKQEIHAHIHFIYERFLLEGIQSEDWTEPVMHWLNAYEPYVPDDVADE